MRLCKDKRDNLQINYLGSCQIQLLINSQCAFCYDHKAKNNPMTQGSPFKNFYMLLWFLVHTVRGSLNCGRLDQSSVLPPSIHEYVLIHCILGTGACNLHSNLWREATYLHMKNDLWAMLTAALFIIIKKFNNNRVQSKLQLIHKMQSFVHSSSLPTSIYCLYTTCKVLLGTRNATVMQKIFDSNTYGISFLTGEERH